MAPRVGYGGDPAEPMDDDAPIGNVETDADGDTDDSDIVEAAKERFERGKTFVGPMRSLAIADTRFVMGDADNGWQWPDDVARRRDSQKKVRLTVNGTAQHCNQIINGIRSNRPAAKVRPADSKSDKRTAEILEGLLRNIHASGNADIASDTAAEHAIYGGEGYWRVRTEYENERSFNQRIVIDPIANPCLVIIDPNAKLPTRADAKWGFIFEDVPKSELEVEYPGIEPANWQGVEDPRGWHDKVRIAEYFWCSYRADELWFMPDGSTVLKSEAGPVADKPVKTRKTRIPQWHWAKLVGGEEKPVESRDWPGKYLPIITVIGKEVNVDGEIIRKGIVRDLKDPARIVNYSYSETVETLALQTKSPYLVADEVLEGHEDVWKSANLETRAYLPWNAYDSEGNQLPKPSREAPPQMSVGQVQLLQLSTEQMRAASGQQNANFGIRSEASSGVGIQRLKQQGEIATFHYPDNLSRALEYEAVVIIDLIQKVYDTRRVERILGLDGEEEMATLDPANMQAYSEQRDEVTREIERIFNPTLGLYDIVIDTGPSYQTQRQEAFAALSDIAAKNPQVMQIAGDLIMKAADFPMADEMAERFRRALPPNLQDGEDEVDKLRQQVAQLTQGMQQGGQQMRELEAKLDELELEKRAKVIEQRAKLAVAQEDAKLDGYKAETERLKTLGAAMGPEQVQVLVLQLLEEMLGGPALTNPMGPQPMPAEPMPQPMPQPGFDPMQPEPGMQPPISDPQAMPADPFAGTPPAATGALPGPGMPDAGGAMPPGGPPVV